MLRKTTGLFSKYRLFLMLSFAFLTIILSGLMYKTSEAKDTSIEIQGSFYEFPDNVDFTFSDKESYQIEKGNSMGTLFISGDVSETAGVYQIHQGNSSFSYLFAPGRLKMGNIAWHVIDDNGNKVDSIKLKKNIDAGTLILQSSLDGEIWNTEAEYTDIFKEDSALKQSLYSTTEIQQENGSYFRIIVAYRMQRMVGRKKILGVPLTKYETKRVAEVYDFYVINAKKDEVSSANDKPRKELGSKIETNLGKGYSGQVEIDNSDPHYGWDLGNFTVNGYTRETRDDEGTPVFLKNVGDKVTLWFTLNQNIDALNGDASLEIADDGKGYDRYFEIPKTDFGRGTLIVQYTDYEGVKGDPVIYTNYLEANTKTGADTKVRLFEEGDYEVSLDYKIKSNPRQVGNISLVPEYKDYKIMFKFKVRNGNCMVFPFDLKNGNELFDKSITENGFMLDMARSRYLTIDVKRSTLQIDSDGLATEDVRFNRPAKDGEKYTDEGIYTFTVKNLYTDSEETSKTIYVGNNNYLSALSRNGFTVSELNDLISQGYEVDDAGYLIIPLTNDNIQNNNPLAAILKLFIGSK